jgi:hypothetical protein
MKTLTQIREGVFRSIVKGVAHSVIGSRGNSDGPDIDGPFRNATPAQKRKKAQPAQQTPQAPQPTAAAERQAKPPGYFSPDAAKKRRRGMRPKDLGRDEAWRQSEIKRMNGIKESKDDSELGRVPNLVILKRKSIRMFPNGVKVALYHSDRLKKDFSVTFSRDDADLVSDIKN